MISESPGCPEQALVAERCVRSRLQSSGGPMAYYQSSLMHEDLGPAATSALGAAYDAALQSLQAGGAEEHILLRYSLATHLMRAAFRGELDADLLRERASAYVTEWFKQPRLVA